MGYLSATKISLNPAIDPSHGLLVLDAYTGEPVQIDPYEDGGGESTD